MPALAADGSFVPLSDRCSSGFRCAAHERPGPQPRCRIRFAASQQQFRCERAQREFDTSAKGSKRSCGAAAACGTTQA